MPNKLVQFERIACNSKTHMISLGPHITTIPVVCAEGLYDVATYNGYATGETFLDFVNTTLAHFLLTGLILDQSLYLVTYHLLYLYNG